ncbi:CAP domain-containing protein [Sphingomonas sp. Leaf4]|uniref:CAP domain-containing protein n=1 Tax=Sphingomonas sp. Leaf4 TaxID=2876553 RepID=UPI001E4A62C5|nr:CAP domain-containing protein [Sphingomonas sp. Leaf4]
MRGIQILTAALLLGGCSAVPASGPERVVEPRAFDGVAPRGAALLRQAMEAGHRAARAEAGLPPLVWDPALAADAKRYASEMARTGKFEHSPQPRGTPEQGENLWTGTRGAYRYDEMVGHWVAEKRYYLPVAVPASSNTGNFGDVAHYTQILWRTTQRYGCAEASNAKDDFIACRYVPAGNIVGQRAF